MMATIPTGMMLVWTALAIALVFTSCVCCLIWAALVLASHADDKDRDETL